MDSQQHGATDRLRTLAPFVLAALVVAVPFAARRAGADVDWSAADFALAAIVLFGAAGLYAVARQELHGWACRAGVCIAIATGVALLWINLAVGIAGTENDPANLVFGGVLLVALAGAGLARRNPQALARAFAATALAQLIAGAIAAVAVAVPGQTPKIAALTAVFVALWLASAWLVGRGARAVRPG